MEKEAKIVHSLATLDDTVANVVDGRIQRNHQFGYEVFRGLLVFDIVVEKEPHFVDLPPKNYGH